MGSTDVLCIPRFIMTGSAIQISRGRIHRHIDYMEITAYFNFFQNKKNS
jgi:hypothetical protein